MLSLQERLIMPRPFQRGVTTLVCGRVKDPQIKPAPGSIKFQCELCTAAIWIEAKHVLRREVEHLPSVCLDCFRWYQAGSGEYTMILPGGVTGK
jgi:hypothetical protein